MVVLNKNVLIKIPNYINFFYNQKYNLIILKFSMKKILIKLNSFCYIFNIKTKVFIFAYRKNLNIKTIISNIKRFLVNIEIKIYKKLKLIGIGYKVVAFKNFLYNVFLFKIGFSHPIFFKSNHSIFCFCLKFTNFFIIDDFSYNINKICSLIRSFKTINIYTGKGILFYNKFIDLKKNKKKIT